jgi:hypothetical protein
VNVCRSCGQDFCSVEAFDAHRVGRHEYPWSIDRPDGRRCLSAVEITDAGWEQNQYGRWVHPKALRNRPREGGYAATGDVAPHPEAHDARPRSEDE